MINFLRTKKKILILLFLVFLFPHRIISAEDNSINARAGADRIINEGGVLAEKVYNDVRSAQPDNMSMQDSYRNTVINLSKSKADAYYELNLKYDSSGNKLYAGEPDPETFGQQYQTLYGVPLPFTGTLSTEELRKKEFELLKSKYSAADSSLKLFLSRVQRDVNKDSAAADILKKEAEASQKDFNSSLGALEIKERASSPVACSFESPKQSTLMGCVAIGAFNMLQLTVWIFGLVAMLFNYVITYTLDMSSLLSKIAIVDIGWTAIRDIINLSFIFLVLYAAINTIVGESGYGIKNMLSKIVIAAVLINFSLFFTQVMIDVSNIFALTFYNKITNNIGTSGTDTISGISATVSHAIGIDSLLEFSQKGAESINLDALSIIEYSFGSIIFILITTFVLGAGALMLVARAVTLIFLMMLSPIAFISGVIPQAKKVSDQWWGKLTSNLMFAPMYMAFIYLVIFMATNLNGKYNLYDVFTDSGDWEKVLATLFNMVIINGMMAASLLVAGNFGAVGSKTAMSWGKAGLDKLSDATVGLGYRQTVGKTAAWIASKPGFQKSLANNMAGRALLRGTRALGSGYVDRVSKKAEAKTKFIDSLSKEDIDTGKVDSLGNPIKTSAQKSAREHLSGKTGSMFTATRLAAANAAIAHNKTSIEDAGNAMSDIARKKKLASEGVARNRREAIANDMRTLLKPHFDDKGNYQMPDITSDDEVKAIIERIPSYSNLTGNEKDFAKLYMDEYLKSKDIDRLKDKGKMKQAKDIAGRGGFRP